MLGNQYDGNLGIVDIVGNILNPIGSVATAWLGKDIIKQQAKIEARRLKAAKSELESKKESGQDWMKVAIFAGSLLAAGLVVYSVMRKKSG